MNRPSWDEYFLKLVGVVAERSTCLRAQNGCILVRDKYVLTTGYCGAPSGVSHCTTCMREELNIPSGTHYELCRSVHAEANAIIQAAKLGISIDGATAYITSWPCGMCSRLLIQANVHRWFLTDPEQKTEVSDAVKEMIRKFVVVGFLMPNGETGQLRV